MVGNARQFDQNLLLILITDRPPLDGLWLIYRMGQGLMDVEVADLILGFR